METRSDIKYEIVKKFKGKNGNIFYKLKCEKCNYERIVLKNKFIRKGLPLCKFERGISQKSKNLRIYRILSNIIMRCYDRNKNDYIYYGKRGIKVCNEWRNNFDSFCTWALSNGYLSNLQIDRIDNDGNYCPENCRWATKVQQMNNKSNNIVVTYKGEDITLAELCRKSGTKYPTVYARFKNGWETDNLLLGLIANEH